MTIATHVIVAASAIVNAVLLLIIIKRMEKLMADTSALKAEFEAYRDDVKAKVAALGTKIDQLQNAVKTDDTEAIAALTEEIKAAHADLDGTASAPTTSPAPPPL